MPDEPSRDPITPGRLLDSHETNRILDEHSADTDRSPARALDACGRREIGGPKGPEPTRYGDWERAGRCIDF
jgi:hypothetical protein